MTTEEKIKVMQAYLDGEIIEVRSPSGGMEWREIEFEPQWNWSTKDYRIKPKEKTSIPATEEELEYMTGYWLKIKKNGNIFYASFYRASTFNKSLYYILNHETKCWEDWSKK